LIRVDFRGFWKGFDCKEVFFFKYLLDENFLILDKNNPQIIIYSDNHDSHSTELEDHTPRVFYSVENYPIPKHLFKYTLTYHKDSKSNFRFNNFFYYPFFHEITNNRLSDEYLYLRNRKKDKHINFIYSNSKGKMRNDFYKFLSEHYEIDSYGKHQNNMGPLPSVRKDMYSGVMQKNILLSQYKFTIAFENSLGLNYISEKIWQPLAVNSIPIYWGSPAIFDFFNRKKIIYISSKSEFGGALKKIKEINSSESLYQDFLNEPIFKDEKTKTKFKFINLSKRLVNFFDRVIEDNSEIKHAQSKYFFYLLQKLHKRFNDEFF
jgi:hypothetical protein